MIRIVIRILLVAVFLYITASCVEPGHYQTRERYVVDSKSLFIRSAPSPISEIISSYKQGDTIVALASDKYWVMVKRGSKTGFVSTDYLKKIEPPKTPIILEKVEGIANWKSWYFWVIALAITLLWVFIDEMTIKFKEKLKNKHEISVKGLLITPVVFFVNAIMCGVLYINWKDQLLESLHKGFSLVPENLDIISWVLWIQLLILLIGISLDLLGSIFKSGVAWGMLLTLIDLLLGVYIFAVSFYLTISLYYFAIIFLLIFFGSQYISMVYQNSKRTRLYQRPK
ncbi:MAG TPA: SH3 domain-containing protein [Tenuifilaceae bacterium]|nr:SH3 domain-containing protein [Tenuifilaceae bacterium]HPI44959.1 SH3 domain-containing protein [Tenuifilaceae bacterium]HPN20294.1 SH3 domain-containing protein [Tenuifilaceae bacterium]